MTYLAVRLAIPLSLASSVLCAGCDQKDPEEKVAPPPYLQEKQQIENSSMEKWLASQPDLNGVEIKLWHHSGILSDGSLIAIKGNGGIVRSRQQFYPITEQENSITEHLRLPLPKEKVSEVLGLFNDSEILRLPRSVPELVHSPDQWPKEIRYSLGLTIPGVGAFEGEHPDIEWSKMPQSAPVRRLVRRILELVAELEERIRLEDVDFLKKDRALALVKDALGNLRLELWDIQGLWGGMAVRLEGDGRVQGVFVRPPKAGESGMQVRRFQGDVGKERATGILALL